MVDVGVSGEATKTTLGVFIQPQVTQFAGKDWSCGNHAGSTPAQLASAVHRGQRQSRLDMGTMVLPERQHTTSKEQKDAQRNKQMLKGGGILIFGGMMENHQQTP